MLCLWGTAARAQGTAQVTPLVCAHAHNDYEHKRPLLDALDHGFCSVEADVWLVDGQLLVAHTTNELNKARTLQALYLDPLRERAEKNGGRIYAGGPTVLLLIDFKSEATNTYRALMGILKPYEKILTKFQDDKTETNAVTVIITGNRSRDMMESDAVRLAGYEGLPADLDKPVTRNFMPLISDMWRRHFKWRGDGPMVATERTKLKAMTASAHERGMIVRFWAIPDNAAAWTQLLDAGVDLINTDHLDEFRDFCLTNNAAKAKH